MTELRRMNRYRPPVDPAELLSIADAWVVTGNDGESLLCMVRSPHSPENPGITESVEHLSNEKFGRRDAILFAVGGVPASLARI